jgi:hypothetical protein
LESVHDKKRASPPLVVVAVVLSVPVSIWGLFALAWDTRIPVVDVALPLEKDANCLVLVDSTLPIRLRGMGELARRWESDQSPQERVVSVAF